MATIEQLVGITAQYNEIAKRVGNGSLDPISVRRTLQDIIEGKTPMTAWNPPSWWQTPERQLDRARQFWPGVVLPDPPYSFMRRTETEVLLLHVPDTFDSLWDKVVVPAGYTKDRSDSVKSDKRNLRLAPNVPNRIEPVWLAFDPEHGKGKCPDSFWGQSNLAASEVLSALIQFPVWPFVWFNGASAPNLAGYQLKYDADWSRVPYLDLWDDDDDDRQLKLRAHWVDRHSSAWASPWVRVC
jgi:hypothetical protein